jgi:hypothetical protein
MSNKIATFSLGDINELGYEHLLNILKVSPGKCSISYPRDLYCHHHIDFAIGELERAFIGEILSDYASSITYIEKTYSFYIEYFNPSFPQVVYWLSGLSYYGDDDYSDEYMVITDNLPFKFSVHEEFHQFEGDIFEGKRPVKFYALVDDYFANMILDENTWYDKQETLNEHPEWAFHMWRSAWSSKLGFDLYVSPIYWLLHESSNISEALKTASFMKEKDYQFKESNSVYSDLLNILIFTKYDVISLPQEIHYEAVRCAEILFPIDDEPRFNVQYDWYSQGHFSLTSNNSILRWTGQTFQYIIFRDSFTVLNHNALRHLTKHTQALLNSILCYSNESISLKFDWSKLDDERFEAICYHLVLRDGRFSAEKTKKMGHARSRDGGRDIVTEVVRRTGDKGSAVWIVQCKFSLQKKSLGRNEILLSELIDEYLPSGIIIATNTLVDSGTYDKYERISKNRKIIVDVWDGLRIERELNKNPDLFTKFFK